jgi:hypothetical protein
MAAMGGDNERRKAARGAEHAEDSRDKQTRSSAPGLQCQCCPQGDPSFLKTPGSSVPCNKNGLTYTEHPASCPPHLSICLSAATSNLQIKTPLAVPPYEPPPSPDPRVLTAHKSM